MSRVRAIFLVFLICAGIGAAPAKVRPEPQRPQIPAAPQLTVRDATFQSASLGRAMKYRIYLPANYDRSVRRYPVLYLLHGLTGDYTNWDTHTHLAEYAAPLRLIIVMPDADDSWYANSVTNPRDRYEDYIVKDLIAEIDRSYRTIATRHARAIAGLSMGGYGAMKFALKHPELFVFAGSFSGTQPVAHDPVFKTHIGGRYDQQLPEIFGPAESPARAANDIFALAEKANAAELPYLWLACGTSDHLLQGNRQFVALLQQRKIAYTYKEAPGAHTWAFWDDQLPAMFRELSRHMDLGPPHPILPPMMPATRPLP